MSFCDLKSNLCFKLRNWKHLQEHFTWVQSLLQDTFGELLEKLRTWEHENILARGSPEFTIYTCGWTGRILEVNIHLSFWLNWRNTWGWYTYFSFWLNWRNTWSRYTLQFLTELEEYLRLKIYFSIWLNCGGILWLQSLSLRLKSSKYTWGLCLSCKCPAAKQKIKRLSH